MLSRKLFLQPARVVLRPQAHALRAASTMDESSLLKFAWTPRTLALYEAQMQFKQFAEDNFTKVKAKVEEIPNAMRNMQVAAEESIRTFMGSPRDLLLYESHLHYNDFIQDNFRAGDMTP